MLRPKDVLNARLQGHKAYTSGEAVTKIKHIKTHQYTLVCDILEQVSYSSRHHRLIK